MTKNLQLVNVCHFLFILFHNYLLFLSHLLSSQGHFLFDLSPIHTFYP